MNRPIVAPWRDRVSYALMLLVALGASFAFATASRAVTAAPPGAKAVEIWRMLGYLVFCAIFILLALRPRRHPGLWEVSFFHMAGVSGFLAATAPGVSADIVAVDATIAVVIAVCYFLTRGYVAWNVTEPAPTSVPARRSTPGLSRREVELAIGPGALH